MRIGVIYDSTIMYINSCIQYRNWKLLCPAYTPYIVGTCLYISQHPRQ